MTHFVERQHIAAMAEQLAPMCDGDEQLLQDMMEGETDLLSVVSRLHEMRSRDEETLVGIKERKAALAEREKRIKTRAEKLKQEIGDLLRLSHLSKIELAEATYSVRDGKPKLDVVDADAVPADFQRVTHSPDKTKINEHFADADDLPNWLVREPARDVVTARTK